MLKQALIFTVRYGVAGAYGVISVVLLSIFTVVYLRQLNKSGGLD